MANYQVKLVLSPELVLRSRASVDWRTGVYARTPKIRWPGPGVRVRQKWNGWRTRTPKKN